MNGADRNAKTPSRWREIRTLGANVRRCRRARGWTLDMVATAAGVSKGFLSLVENGKTEPSALTLRDIARGLCVPIDALLATKRRTAQASPEKP